MNALITNCPRCDALFRLPVEALLLTHGSGNDAAPGRVAYICLDCGDLVDEPMPEPLAHALTAAGVQFIDVEGVES